MLHICFKWNTTYSCKIIYTVRGVGIAIPCSIFTKKLEFKGAARRRMSLAHLRSSTILFLFQVENARIFPLTIFAVGIKLVVVSTQHFSKLIPIAVRLDHLKKKNNNDFNPFWHPVSFWCNITRKRKHFFILPPHSKYKGLDKAVRGN